MPCRRRPEDCWLSTCSLFIALSSSAPGPELAHLTWLLGSLEGSLDTISGHLNTLGSLPPTRGAMVKGLVKSPTACLLVV